MKVVLVADLGDTGETFRVVIKDLRAIRPPIKIYIGSKDMFDYELALTHRADGWIDLPKNNSGQEA